jgi:serralysin
LHLSSLAARLLKIKKTNRGTARSRRVSLQLESLELRAVFSGNPLLPTAALDVPDVVFAPDTSAEVVNTYNALQNRAGFDAFTFTDTDRWTRTVTSGSTSLAQGDATVIRWSIAPDGTAISGYNGEAATPSNLRAFLNGIYGANTASTRAQDQPWFGTLQSVFDRWSAVSGVNYVYEANDDGAAISSSYSGVVGVRGDVRISGHYIDGPSNVLAYNFYPTFGDMVIDTGDTFFSNTASNSLRLRNTMAHEAGHGLGLDHVEPVTNTKLMEPYISLNYDGPQADDILAVNRGYGDRLEKNGGNNTAATATALGAASTFTIDTVSIDDDTDVDWFQFTVGANSTLSVTLTPTGSTYVSNGVTFNSLAESDLALAVYGGGGSTLIASASATGAGVAETLNNLALAGSGTYYVRVTGTANAAQMYRLSGSVTNVVAAAPEIAVFNGATEVADNMGAASFGSVTQGAASSLTFTVRNTGTAVLTLGSAVTLPAGFTSSTIATSVAPGASTSFTVTMNTSVIGARSGMLSLVTNDADENPFNFALSGAVTAPAPATAPEIAVLDGTTDIADNTGVVSFGTVNVGAAATKTFAVRNAGTGALSLGALTLPAGYTASGLSVNSLAPGATTTFSVSLNTATAGTFSGTLSLTNNDSNEGPFNFALSGTVVAPQPTTTFSDNFNRTSSASLGANWTERAGNMAVSTNGLANQITGTSLATVNTVSPANAILTADVNLGGGSSTRDSGLVARQSGTGTGNQYWAGLRYSGGRYTAEIWEANNGVWTRLSSANVSSGIATIRFEAIGSALKLYVSNVLTNSVVDGTLTSGRVGVSLSGTAARLDNFSVAQPAALTAPAATASPGTAPGYAPQWLAMLDHFMQEWEESHGHHGGW